MQRFNFTSKPLVKYRVRGDVSSLRTFVWMEDSNGSRVEASYLSLSAMEIKLKNKAESAKRRARRMLVN